MLGCVYGTYQYLKPAATEVKQAPVLSIDSDLLLDAYVEDEVQADRYYLGKVIQVSGEVVAVDEIGKTVNVNLATDEDFGLVVCGFDNKVDRQLLVPGKPIRVAGICDGFTGIDVQLSKCRIVE
jgi:hypothetical protein